MNVQIPNQLLLYRRLDQKKKKKKKNRLLLLKFYCHHMFITIKARWNFSKWESRLLKTIINKLMQNLYICIYCILSWHLFISHKYYCIFKSQTNIHRKRFPDTFFIHHIHQIVLHDEAIHTIIGVYRSILLLLLFFLTFSQ